MKFNLISLGLDKSSVSAIKENSEFYNCVYQNCEDFEVFEEVLKISKGVSIVLIDLEDEVVCEVKKYQLTSKISKYKNVHVIFAAIDMDAQTRVRWLGFGAKSYILKPFLSEELLIRAKIIAEATQDNYIRDDNFLVDFKKRSIDYQDRLIKTTGKMFDLIVFFMENEGKVMTREEIMLNVFGSEHYLNDRNIDTLIKEVRKRTNTSVVKTVRGIGYVYNEKGNASKITAVD